MPKKNLFYNQIMNLIFREKQMKKNLFLAITVFIILLLGKTAFASEKPKLQIIYPEQNQEIRANSIFFVGNTNPDAKLFINNKPVKVYPNGGFVEVVNLKEGRNLVKLTSILMNTKKELVYILKRPLKPVSLSEKPLRIIESSIYPNQDIIYKTGDTIKVRFQGSPGYNASFYIGQKEIPMIELSTKTADIRGIYEGFYKPVESDNFYNSPVKVRLKSSHTRLTKHSKATVSSLIDNKPLTAEVIKDKSVVREAPDGNRLTPLPAGNNPAQ